jgi:hypothetical protein
MPHAARNYSPLYFLASLGAGGLAVTFFMWLMFWVPHPDQPVPIFENNWAVLTGGTLLQQAMVLGAMAGIAVFAYLNIKLLVFNLRKFAAFRRSESYAPSPTPTPAARSWPCRWRSPCRSMSASSSA